jgi:putative NADH-flavin reductase
MEPAPTSRLLGLLVLGARRGIGAEVMKAGVEAGHRMTGFFRLPSARFTDTASYRQGDVRNPDDLETAVVGQDAVIWTVGTGITRDEVTLFSDGTRKLIAAMKHHGVNKLVAVTGIGAGNTKGHGGFSYDHIINPLFLRTIYADKDRQEELIRASGLEWLIVRPGHLTSGPRTGEYRVITDLQGVRSGKISRADVADFILRELADPQHWFRTPLVTS